MIEESPLSIILAVVIPMLAGFSVVGTVSVVTYRNEILHDLVGLKLKLQRRQPPRCEDCVHYIPDTRFNTFHKCDIEPNSHCSNQRNFSFCCGENGRHFKSKIVKVPEPPKPPKPKPAKKKENPCEDYKINLD